MASGQNARERDLSRLLNSMFERIRRLERPASVRVGGAGGAVGGYGWTIGVNSSGQLVATNDSGRRVVLASPE